MVDGISLGPAISSESRPMAVVDVTDTEDFFKGSLQRFCGAPVSR